MCEIVRGYTACAPPRAVYMNAMLAFILDLLSRNTWNMLQFQSSVFIKKITYYGNARYRKGSTPACAPPSEQTLGIDS